MSEDAGPSFRRPRCRLVISGGEIAGCQSVEVFSTNLGQASAFFAQVAIHGAGSGKSTPWYTAETLDVSLQMGFLPPGTPESNVAWREMISGAADRIRLDPISGTVTLDGRDYAARLLDFPVSEGFLNSTSSELAQKLAASSGLLCDVEATTVMIGQYYQVDHARSALARFSRFGTAWDLLASLAQLEGFDIWVSGQTLYFKSSSQSSSKLHVISLGATVSSSASPSLNVTSLHLERSLVHDAGLPVSVLSWNSRQRRRIAGVAGPPDSLTSRHLKIVRPNLLPDSAQMLADGVYAQTSGHRQTLHISMPGELDMTPRDCLRLIGLGPNLDGKYSIESITREMSLVGGFSQRVAAKIM